MIEPKIGHIVNWKDEDGKWHKAGQVIYKETGFNYAGEKRTLYTISDGSNVKHKVFAEDMEYYHY